MLNYLKGSLNFLSESILHPQWLANKYHRVKLQPLKIINNRVLLDVGSGRKSLKNIVNPSNTLYTSDYPTTSFRYQNSPHIYLDAKDLPIANACLDGVICYEVLEHIDFSDRVIEEFSRVLKPKGEIYLSVPFLYPEHDAPHDYFRFTTHGLVGLLKRHGFSVTHTLKLGEGVDGFLLLCNIFLLLIVRSMENRIGILVLPFAMACYFLCVCNNFLSVFLKLILPNIGSFYLGVSIVAVKQQ